MGYVMTFDEMIQLKALQIKARSSVMNAKIIDDFAESDSAQAKALMRNLCASIPHELFDRLENTCGYLDISKRQFVESALIVALDLSDSILAEIDPQEEI